MNENTTNSDVLSNNNFNNQDIHSEIDSFHISEQLNIHIHNEKTFKKRIFGLRSKVALKEAIGCILLSVIVLFVPIGTISLDIIILAPVIYVMVSFSISSFTNILNGSVIVIGLAVGAVYNSILIQIIDRVFWVGYILNFLFVFILYSVMPGKRWINLFACKMMVIQIISNIYFSYTMDKYQVLSQFFSIFCLMVACIVFVSIFLFPWLGTRLFLKKVVKTLHSSRNLFSAVGYQLEAKLDMEEIIETNQSPPLKNNKSFIYPVYYIDMYKEQNFLKEDNNNEIELNEIRESSLNIQVNDFKRNKIPFKSATIKIPTNQEIVKLESKFQTQIYRLTTLLAECRTERWNAVLIGHYEAILSQLSFSHKQLISLKQAIDEGFSNGARHNIVLPMVPFIDSLVEEVSLQINLLIDILSSEEKYDYELEPIIDLEKLVGEKDIKFDTNSIHFKRIVLQMSFNETTQLVNRAKEFYKTLVKDFQKYSHEYMLSEREITKLHYFIIGTFEFSLYQSKILDNILKIKKNQRHESVMVEILKFGIWYIISSLPIHWYKRCIRFKNLISSYYKEEKEKVKEDRDGFKGFFKKIFKFLWIWCYNTFYVNGRWHFPLQVSVGFLSTNLIFHYFDLKTYNELVVHGLWACITTIIVFQPTLGSTMTRSIHRIVGTTFGGFMGFLVSWLTSTVGAPWREILLLCLTFIWVFIVSHVQQDVRYSYAGSVGGLTFILITYGQYLSHNYSVMYAVLRLFFIILGIVWVLAISLVIFPFFTYKDTRSKMFNNLNTITTTFIKILESNLPLFNTEIPKDDQVEIDMNLPIPKPNQEKRKTFIPIEYEKEIYHSFRTIRIVNSQIFASLVDVKSEFILKPKSFSKYQRVYVDLINLHTRLVMSEIMFNYKFSDSVLVELDNSFRPIEQLIIELRKLSNDFNLLISSKPMTKEYNNGSELLNHLIDLENVVRKARESLVSRKVLYSFYPDMIHYGAALFSIHDFIKFQISLFNHLLGIKKTITQ